MRCALGFGFCNAGRPNTLLDIMPAKHVAVEAAQRALALFRDNLIRVLDPIAVQAKHVAVEAAQGALALFRDNHIRASTMFMSLDGAQVKHMAVEAAQGALALFRDNHIRASTLFMSLDGAQAKHVAVEAAQRALALFQCLGNLHCFSPSSSAPHLRHRFARLLAAQLRARGAPQE